MFAVMARSEAGVDAAAFTADRLDIRLVFGLGAHRRWRRHDLKAQQARRAEPQ
jgi:hypothetical protein